MKLSIVVPTYNRPQMLKKNLPEVVRQLSDDVELVIIDNCSPVPALDVISEIGLAAHDRIRIVRNPVNVGANENISRAAEHALGRFVWVLGDDDTVTNDCVSKILTKIAQFADAVFINFNTPAPAHVRRSEDKFTVGLNNFLSAIDSFGQIIFISDGVYSTDFLRKNLRFAKFYQGTCAPLFCALVLGMSDEHQCVLSKDQIISADLAGAPENTQLSLIPIALGFSKIHELPVSRAAELLLKRAVLTAQKNWVTPAGIFHQLILQARFQPNSANANSVFDSIDRGYFRLDRSVTGWMRRKILKTLVRFPRIGFSVFSLAYAMKKKDRTGVERLKDRGYL